MSYWLVRNGKRKNGGSSDGCLHIFADEEPTRAKDDNYWLGRVELIEVEDPYDLRDDGCTGVLGDTSRYAEPTSFNDTCPSFDVDVSWEDEPVEVEIRKVAK